MEKETYYRGIATRTDLGVDTGIIIIAKSEKEALERYNECICRHSNLKGKENPQIGDLWNALSLIEEQFSEAMKTELQKERSVVE